MSFENNIENAKKAKTLDELFEIWEKAHFQESENDWDITNGDNPNIPKDHFIRDGIIDDSVFQNEKLKVLFISNEANINDYIDDNDDKDRRTNFCKYYNCKQDHWRGKMCERICAVFNEIIQQPSIDYYKSAKRFAFMNINKRGGGNNIGNGSHIQEYCKLYKDFIKKEIELIAPDLIIWLGIKTYNMNLLQIIGAEYKGNVLFINVNGHDVPIMKMWHTSYYRARKKCLSNYNEVEKEYMSIGINNELIIKLAAKARLEYDLLNK